MPEIYEYPHNYSMHIDGAKVMGFVYENRLSLSAGFGAIASAVAFNSPESIPKTPQDFWTWGRESVHSLLNSRRLGK